MTSGDSAGDASPAPDTGGHPVETGLTRTVGALEELLATLARLVKATSAVLLLREGEVLTAAVRVGAPSGGPAAGALALDAPLAARLLAAEPLAVVDLREEPPLAASSRDAGLGPGDALCGAPMRSLTGGVLGLVVLAFPEHPNFGASDIVLVGGSTRQAAEMVERARLHDESRALAERERRHGQRLRMLADAALGMSREFDVERILALVTEAACAIVGTRQGVTTRLQRGTEQASTHVWVAEGPQRPPSPDDLVAPLIARDGGNLGLVRLSDKTDGSAFAAEDEAMLVQLAQMASVSIENAELIDRERAARLAAEESARLRGVLSDASAAFAASLDLEEVLSAITSILVPEFADWCGVTLLRSDGALQLVAESATDEAMARAIATLRERMPPSLERPHGVGAVIRTGRSEFFPAVPKQVLATLAASGGLDPELLYGLGIESGIIVPLPMRGRTLGALTLIRGATAPAYGPDELSFAEDLASRAALAIENATRFTLERQAADMLQRSLLPRELPRLPGVRAAARYLPGGAGTRIGGDWYDVIALDAHRMAFVVGDVMGRGIPAATVMGQLRAAVRAYALEGHPPVRVLDLVDVLVERMDELQLTTCVFGVYDSRDGTFTVAGAGHPPPLLVSPDGEAAYLELPPGLPLGTGSLLAEPRGQAVIALPSGSTLLFYTDGLVEARDCPIDEGMRRVREAASGCTGEPDALCDRLLAAMGRDGHHDDDTALLALAVTSSEAPAAAAAPPARVQQLAADLRSPRDARRIVADVAQEWGVEDVDTAVLVTHELVTNAVLHAGDPIVLRLERRDALLRVEVADGSDVPPSPRDYEPDSFTGRGLALVEALARRWGWEPASRGKVVWCEVDL